jgi:hypothetical protein
MYVMYSVCKIRKEKEARHLCLLMQQKTAAKAYSESN